MDSVWGEDCSSSMCGPRSKAWTSPQSATSLRLCRLAEERAVVFCFVMFLFLCVCVCVRVCTSAYVYQPHLRAMLLLPSGLYPPSLSKVQLGRLQVCQLHLSPELQTGVTFAGQLPAGGRGAPSLPQLCHTTRHLCKNTM